MTYLELARRGVDLLSILSACAALLAAILFALLVHVILPSHYQLPLLFLDAALSALALLTIHARRGDALSALLAVQSVVRPRKPGTPEAAHAATAEQRRARADTVRDLLDKVAEAALGPLATVVVVVPVGLGVVACLAHVYGRHEVVAGVCGGVAALCVLVGTAPYFIARCVLDRQFDRIAGLFAAEAEETQPLLEA